MNDKTIFEEDKSFTLRNTLKFTIINPLIPDPTKWSNTFKLFVGNLPTNGLSVFVDLWGWCLKVVSAIFYQIFIFHQMIAFQKLRKMFFISSKKLFSFSRYLNFYISVSPSLSPCHPLP